MQGMRRYASGERSGHNCFFFNSFVKSEYVTFTMARAACAICNQKSIGFLVHVRENRAAARRFYRHCLEKSRENIKNHCATQELTNCCFSIRNTMRNATRDQRGAVK